MLLKSIKSTLFLCLATVACLAQSNTFPASGNVGIGTTSPNFLLELKKASESGVLEQVLRLSVSDAEGDYLSISNATGTNGQFIPTISGRRATDNRFALMVIGNLESSMLDYGNHAVVAFDARLANGKVNQRPLFVWQSYQTHHMTMLANGNLGIGTVNPQAKLAVDGNILAKEVKVQTNIAVPDYVFEPDYELTPLAEVEAYVKEHKHLPEIPSAKDIERDGLDLAEMNLLLLKKVEELTLHLIEREKSEKRMASEIQVLKSRMQTMKTNRYNKI